MESLPRARGSAPFRSWWWSRLPLLFLVVAGVPLSACLPIVSHGPAVVPGLGVTATAAAGWGAPLSTECEHSIISDPGQQPREEWDCGSSPRLAVGPVSLAIGHGWASRSSGGWAYSAALQLPGPVDLYAQAPQPEGSAWTRGVGVLLSPLQVSPYAQFGPADGHWYSTQLISLVNALELEKDYVTPAFWWIPSLTWAPAAPRDANGAASRLRLHLVGGLGAERQRHRLDRARPLRPAWNFSVGLSADLFRRAPDSPPELGRIPPQK